MKMIPVEVSKINVVGLNAVQKLPLDLGKIPPASPVARSDKPGIEKYRLPFVLNEHSGVTKDRELHSSLVEKPGMLPLSRSGY